MARPKGSKNVAKPAQQPVQEFDYETMGDTAYAQVMSGTAPIAELTASSPTPSVQLLEAQYQAPQYDNVTALPAYQPTEKLFLVEGKVRLDQMGSAPIHADQRRIVSASNDDEALQKFVNYFQSMSNEAQVYSVVSAAASETII